MAAWAVSVAPSAPSWAGEWEVVPHPLPFLRHPLGASPCHHAREQAAVVVPGVRQAAARGGRGRVAWGTVVVHPQRACLAPRVTLAPKAAGCVPDCGMPLFVLSTVSTAYY